MFLRITLFKHLTIIYLFVLNIKRQDGNIQRLDLLLSSYVEKTANYESILFSMLEITQCFRPCVAIHFKILSKYYLN